MNFSKKTLSIFLAFTLFSANIKGISEERMREIEVAFFHSWNVGDCITQVSSIYSSDTTNRKTIDILAKFRTLFNVVANLSNCSALYRYRKSIPWPFNAAVVLEGILRSLNVVKDVKIWKKSNVIESVNNTQKSNTNLKYKKLCQYLWLTLDKFLPLIVSKYKGRGSNAHQCMTLLSVYSDLIRQHFMYKMIENKQKVA